MSEGAEWLVNRLLNRAGALRRAALATALPEYRTKMLKAARELEAQAAHIETKLTELS